MAQIMNKQPSAYFVFQHTIVEIVLLTGTGLLSCILYFSSARGLPVRSRKANDRFTSTNTRNPTSGEPGVNNIWTN